MKKIILLLALSSSFLAKGQGIITTIAGNGIPAYIGDGGPATASELNRPTGVISDASGNIYIGDFGNNVVRKINAAGIISTIAGTGVAGYAGDGGQATAAQLYAPSQLFLDASGNLYIAEFSNNVIRKINTSGIISTVAGNGYAGYSGDGGPATAATFNAPGGVYVDMAGNIFITDFYNSVIREVNTSGIISTFAGNGFSGYSGDGGPATAAELNLCDGLCGDLAGNIYFSDANNSRVRKIDAAGIITTIAGTGVTGFTGDGGPATAAGLYNPYGVIIDASGNIYIADQNNNTIRMVNSAGIITTLAGDDIVGYSGDGGPATSAELHIPSGVCLDNSGNIYIADQHNHRVRKVIACINSITGEPINDTVTIGDTAIFTVTTSVVSPAYQWQENPGTGFVNLANVLPYSGVNTNTLTIVNPSALLDTTLYRCIVSTPESSSCVDTSSAAILIIENNTGITQVQSSSSVNIFPNPAHNNITIQLSAGVNNGNIQLLDELGQVVSVKNITGNTMNFDLGELPAAVYLLKISTNGTVVYNKVIKN